MQRHPFNRYCGLRGNGAHKLLIGLVERGHRLLHNLRRRKKDIHRRLFIHKLQHTNNGMIGI